MKVAIAVLIVFLLWCPWSWAQSVESSSGLISVPVEKLESWQLRLKALVISLSTTEMNLAKSQQNSETLTNDINSLKNDIENWEQRHRALLTDWTTLGADYWDLQSQFEDLERSYDAILAEFATFQTKLERTLRQKQTAEIVLGVAIGVIIVETFLLIDPFNWIP